ncbi:hypothetical protein JCM11641_002413 [Rhodosporidiobolus odoratus]
MTGKLPPSFSSFPTQPPPPPAFSSFPSPPRPPSSTQQVAPPPAKRQRAEQFLDDLGGELGMQPQPKRDSRRSERRDTNQHDDERAEGRRREGDEGERYKYRDRKGKEREREHEEVRRHRSLREKDAKRKSVDRDDRDRDRDRETQRHKEKKKSGKSYRLIPTLPSTSTSVASPVAASSASSEKAMFYSSRRGDDWNIRYGGLHRGDIPKYSRYGRGKVIGLNEGLRITRESAYSGRGVEVAPVNRSKTPRYVDSSSYRHLTNRNSKRLILAPRQPVQRIQALGEKTESTTHSNESDSEPDQPDFVPLPRDISTSEKLSRLEHEDGTDYRSIDGLVNPCDLAAMGSEDEDDDDDFNHLGIIGGETHAEYLRRRNLELDRSLRDNPGDVQGWLDFVDFQDELAQTSFSGATSAAAAKRALSKAERASTSEIKLSILERALSATEENRSSENLLLAQLEAAAEVEESKKVLERWQAALQTFPELTGLWIKYVSWRQTEWVTFDVTEVVTVFEESLAVLMGAMQRQEPESSGRELLEGNAIYLFLRLCLMLRQAGYSERGLASFQAVVELNLFRPSSLASPGPLERPLAWSDRLLRDFEVFWDGEAPRIGEQGAKGWRNTSEDDLPPEPPTPGNEVTAVPQQDAHARPHERWATTERLSAHHSRPARTSDPGIDDSDDPYRVVLFDDIKPFLFVLHSIDSKLQLAYAFLTFLGLPFVPPDYPTSTLFTTDPFIHSELVERPSQIQRFWPNMSAGLENKRFETIGGEAMEPERRSAIKEPWATPFAATPAAVDLLFGARGVAGWFRTLKKEDLEDVDVELARNALSLLHSAVPDIFLALDLFAFEAAQSPKSAVKLAKQVLRDRRTDLALWDGYARIERSRGKVSDARQVYQTALSMYRSFAERDQVDGPLLWRAWAEMEWEEGQPVTALRVLVAAAGDGQVDLASLATTGPDDRPSPAQSLRARQYYSRSLEAAFQPRATQFHLRNRNHLAFSFALFEYLNTHNLAAAVDILETHLFRLDVAGACGSAEHEEALMMYAKLLYRHTSVGGGYRPTQLRDLLERAIKEFKNNSLFLALFYHNELRMKIQNRFRRTMEELVLRENEATSEGWLFAIFAELHINSRAINVWAVRNLFDRALDNPKTRSSPSIFALYIDFEVRNGELQRAKSLIYRAVRECPWCKEFYLRPFSPALRSAYRARELSDFHHLLLEKGLRVRESIDVITEGYMASDAEDQEDEDDAPMPLTDAGEELLEERQRLMPY